MADPIDLADHRAAVAEYLARARAISTDRWLVPRGDGKWTPAEETRHLILTYRAFIADLRGEGTLRLKGTPLLRRIWRFIALPIILYGRRIPRAVRAPREIRPEGETGERDALLLELHRAVFDFEAVFAETCRSSPGKRLTHPFFGELSLRQAITVAAVHTRHHAAFLPAAPSL
jgi:hypothetical protein